VRRLSLALFFLLAPSAAHAQAPEGAVAPDGIPLVLRHLERVLETDDVPGFAALLTPDVANAQPILTFVADWVVPGITRAVVHERLRIPAPDAPEGDSYSVYVDVLAESGKAGRVGTWLIDLRRDASPPESWRIAALTTLTTLTGLYRLELDPDREFTVKNLTLSAEDFQVRLAEGVAFVADTTDGATGIVLLGRGDFTFSPAPPAEKGQVRIYSGSETLQAPFTSLYVRLNPVDFDGHISAASLTPRTVDKNDFRRADAIFQQNVSLSFGLDLNDLSRETWSVAPKAGDLVTEIQVDKSHLTYMRSTGDPEDIRFFDRTRQRTIAIYASGEKLAGRGPFFDEDDLTAYDILHYDIDASFDPPREWMDGTARVLLVARNIPLTTVILNLSESLIIRSVVSRQFGYLMALRATGQNDVIINLPEPLPPNQVLDLEFVYGGRIPAIPPEREALDLDQTANEFFTMEPEPSYIYTGRSFWYPEGPVTDYATADLILRVPPDFSSVASGAPDEGYPKVVSLQSRNWKEYHYSATQPVRYMAWAISKFVHVDSALVTLPAMDQNADRPHGVSYLQAEVSVESSSMLKRRALELSSIAQDVLRFYGSLVDDIPYQSFSLAVVERRTPGGHSPPYFAALSQPPPATPVAWRSDPAYFSEFPEFFVAHEAAHQWWGQAVGWKNYHEQWLSEGFAQYFAALYAERLRHKPVFDKVISQMTRWTLDKSDQGPVYLGYRLGHLKNDSRIFRALVYNKGALVLHMLRRLMGDEAFFKGVKRFYTTFRFRKAGTQELKAAFEAESHMSLDRFFDRWIYKDSLPHLKFSYRTEPDAVVVRFEQIGDIFDVPVTVTLEYGGGADPVDIMVPLHDRITEQRLPVRGVPKSVEANHDRAAPVIFEK
jgi:Peptidase family M1 domain